MRAIPIKIWSAQNRAQRAVWLVTGLLILLNTALLTPRWNLEHPAAGTGTHPLRVGLVFDVGGRGDKSFNDAAYNGVQLAAKQGGVEAEFVEPGEGTDRESGLRLLAARGFDLVIGVGFVFSDDMIVLAREYPQTRFACVDYSKFDEHGFVTPPPNMVALKFREEEGSYLVGALAGVVASKNHGVVGFVGGMDMPLIHKFEAGYRAGTLRVCPLCQVLVGYAGTSGDAFKNPSKGKELALAQYGAGADVIFHAAGTTGLGVFEAARERGRLAIGVDADQWDEAPGHILTSMTKQVDVSVMAVIQGLKQGHWQGGIQVFGLREGGVDYVYDEPRRGMISREARTQVEALRTEIIAGRTEVPSERGTATGGPAGGGR